MSPHPPRLDGAGVDCMRIKALWDSFGRQILSQCNLANSFNNLKLSRFNLVGNGKLPYASNFK